MADLVERLINRFGQAAVNTVQGHEPSHTRRLHETLLRTFERRRRILGADQGVKLRHKTVSCSLAKVLHRHPSLEIAQTLQVAADYVGKVRHLASLLANYICTWKLDLGQPFPDATQRFFMKCLTCYVQGAGAGYTNGAGPGAAQLPPSTLQRFQDLRNNSNLQALQAPGAPWRLHEVFLYVAKDMATVASTYIQVHFQRRRLAITHWALFHALRAHIMNDDDDPDTQVDMTVRPFTRRGSAFPRTCIAHIQLRIRRIQVMTFDRLEVIFKNKTVTPEKNAEKSSDAAIRYVKVQGNLTGLCRINHSSALLTTRARTRNCAHPQFFSS
ncbi:hypothetical protein JKP88DRAFT_293905 [Tribonema minus]|uniref:Uncharacterized protein n=1 Tax=Tribonema minus TaxID=303371 RepID=A0A835ZP83_9STRA|nr:hypothetical protein JKP88DRAFT_293905 [Tribonema minus]